MKTWSLMAAAVLLAGLLLYGCSDSTSPGGGTLQVSLADAPGDFDAVNIVVESVEVHRAGADSVSGWMTVDASPGTYDLLQLQNGVTAVLVDRALPAGDYTQMRLRLGAGSNVVVDGVTHPLVIPSGLQSGLKLNHPFTIENDAIYEVLLDFDALRSIHQTGMMGGQYLLRPVIHAMTIAPTAGAWRDTVLTGVPVVPMQATDIGTVTLQPQ
ncbi:MAG: DUF4382 domain-containing protein [Candidatus Krumholzibacteriia bacterium]